MGYRRGKKSGFHRRMGRNLFGAFTRSNCVYCSRPDGSMQTYEEKLDSMSRFIIKTQGFDEGAAKQTATELMAKLPARQGR